MPKWWWPKEDPPDSGPFDASQVLTGELEQIELLREARGVGTGSTGGGGKSSPVSPTARAHRERLVGLAFSGGGIRSAVFNLGVLQALARLGLLRHFDYLSTVSGGGYIGSWLAAWVRREGLAKVEAGLESEHPCNTREASDAAAPEPSPIRFLRTYSNYLTPKKGFFSLDTWMAGANYLRNLVLNMTLLVLFLGVLLLLPRLWVSLVYLAVSLVPSPDAWIKSIGALAAAATVLAVPAAVVIARNMDWLGGDGPKPSPRQVLWGAILPFVGMATVMGLWIFSAPRTEAYVPWIGVGAAAFFCFWLLVAVCWYAVWGRRDWKGARSVASTWLGMLILAPVAGAVTSWLLAAIAAQLAAEPVRGAVSWLEIAIWAPSGMVLLFWLTGILYIGLLGRLLPEPDRQWWSRLNGGLGIAALTLVGLNGVTFYAAPLLRWANDYVVGAVSLSWLISTAAGVVAGRSAATDRKDSNKWLELVARVAPFVFIAGLIALLSFGLHELYPKVREKVVQECGAELAEDATSFPCRQLLPGRDAVASLGLGRSRAHGGRISGFIENELRESAEGMRGQALLIFLSTILLAGVARFLSWRIDVNEFSMHNFYRDRLVRPFLGASRQGRRRPSLFTGFDPEDDLPLQELRRPFYDGPYPILNTVLNVSAGGRDLAWQERQGNSFVFSPLYCGFEPSPEEKTLHRAYRRTEHVARRGRLETGPKLGTAMAVSGAAVSPSMGYHSSPSLAFLMTFFNARLGFWMGNPAHPKKWWAASPADSFATLVRELLSMTRADSEFVHLADGGFFDNLGIYELVRRRCRFILVSDAEADSDLELGGLANAVRRCRSDFGIDIELETGPIRLDPETGFSRWHCAVGTIHYDHVDEGAPKGILVYLKSSLTGDEPDDVLNYRRRNPAFPHESTADQWFDESQFESYRELGRHVALEVFAAAGLEPRGHVCELGEPGGQRHNIENVFVRLRRAWYPPSSAVEKSFTQHTRSLRQLFDKLRHDSDLAYLHGEVYRDLDPADSATAEQTPAVPKKVSAEQLRKGFYFCNQLIQLMEDVYMDLRLDEQWSHPDNRGWINLFFYWARSDMFRKTWAASASTYGLRFQEFCWRRLYLGLGEIEIEELWDHTESEVESFLASAEEPPPLEAEELLLVKKLAERRAGGEENPIRGRIGKIVAGRLATLSSSDELRTRIGLPHEDVRNLETLTFGFAVLDKDNRLSFLRIRRPLRNRGLGRYLLEELVWRYGVEADSLPTKAELRRLGMEGKSVQVENMLRSVANEIDLESSDPENRSVCGLLRLPPTGSLRPRKATWLHALAFLYWAPAYRDQVVEDSEESAVREALQRCSESLGSEEADRVAKEAGEWFRRALVTRDRLAMEIRAVQKGLVAQPWFDAPFEARHDVNLERIAEAGGPPPDWVLQLFVTFRRDR